MFNYPSGGYREQVEHTCTHHDPSSPDWPEEVSEQQLLAASSMFRALGDPARLRILQRLSRGERCVSELAQETGDEISTVSQRLKVLTGERLLSRRRDGKHIYYSLCDQHVGELVQNALAHAGESESTAPRARV